jgi:hydroxyacylglutathione hydrolase
MSEQVLIDRPDCKVIQYKTSCLSHFAYLINCDGEIAIVDPLRDIYSYMMAIDEAGASLKYILETHYHADFVSGFLDLAKKTGAEVVFGPNSNPSFKARVLEDGASIKLGNYTIRCIHTPGHTMESSCFTLEKGNEVLSVFTGDTLFLGDVGRPDLAQKGDLTDKVLAKHLFSSLKKLKKYPDNVLVLPSHGAGSACGKSISTGNKSTIGEQKSTNCAFKEADEAAFIERVTTGLPTPPKYFGDNVRMNKSADVRLL